MKLNLSVFIILLSLGVSSKSAAESENESVKLITKTLSEVISGINITSVEETSIEGIFQVETNSGETLFSSNDGKFFITGDLYTTENKILENLSEQKREGDRALKINSIPLGKKIVFPAKDNTKGKIAVFTDIDCGYCRKLHQEVPALNQMGIEVSYLAYPRAGLNSDSYKKYVSAWCAEDKLLAMTKAKNGQSIVAKKCDNPVAEQYRLGRNIGINGTPAIILEDGTLIPGYINAQKIAQALGIK